MGFLRREPLHKRLAREAGLGGEPAPIDTGPQWGEVGIHGVQRPREWDVVLTVDAELSGDEARFVALPDGALVIDEGPDDLAPLADAVEQSVPPPYRARAVRRGEHTWAVAARAIEVIELPDVEGEELQLTITPDGKTFTVDGAQEFGGVPQLEELLGGDGVVRASRLDGSLWEVQVSRL